MCTNRWYQTAALAYLLMATTTAAIAAYPSASFREIVQKADLIFAGTVARQESRFNGNGSLIVTDVVFRDIQIVHATTLSRQAERSEITVTYAGGMVGDRGLKVSDMPRFNSGGRYLVCVLDDGKDYMNPLVGGPQGVFLIVQDASSEVVLNADRRSVVGSKDADLEFGARRTVNPAGEQSILQAAEPSSAAGMFTTVPAPATSDLGASVSGVVLQSRSDSRPGITLQSFIEVIRRNLSAPLGVECLPNREGRGLWWERRGDGVESNPIQISPLRPFSANSLQLQGTAPRVPKAEGQGLASVPRGSDRLFGQILQACGYHSLPIDMEQVATSDMTYWINNDCMWIWNRFMNLFQYSDDDGKFGPWPLNWENEFVGFIDDGTLHDTYLQHWGSAIGLTMTFYIEFACSKIVQSDVMLNSAASWTNDENTAYANPGIYLVRPTVLHETGHVWGLGNGYDEKYNYDVPTVMHGISDVVENGWGIHTSDAYLIRRHYADQTNVINIRDVGVESYYASDGLNNSQFSSDTCYWNQVLTLYGVTVENIGTDDASRVRVRFYLSPDRTITTADKLMGSYWEWATFPAESYYMGDFTMAVPPDVTPGTYYVGAIVSIDGFGTDDFTQNNATSFYRTMVIKQPPTLALDQTAIDLGPKHASAVISTGFGITNGGQGVLTGTVSEASPWITSVAPTSFNLAAGQYVRINVAGIVPQTAGVSSANVLVSSSSGDQTVELSVTSVVDPPGFVRVLTSPIAIDRGVSVGCSWGDYNNDGYDDLYISNNRGNNLLYENNGGGIFHKIMAGPLVNDGGNSDAASWGDYDNDGNLDLFVAHSDNENSRLYRNQGSGTFVSIAAGEIVNDIGDARGCSWVDYDNDGYLDLFVAKYGTNALFRNLGNGTFTNLASGPPVNTTGSSRGGAWCDFDNDGDQDLFVANYYTRNFLYINNGDGTFTNVPGGPLVSDSGYTCGASWGDYDNDGLMDLYVTHTNRVKNSLFHNEGHGVFTKVTTGDIARDSLFSESSSWMDYNNDGYLDLFVSRGGPFTQSEVLYVNNGNGTFTKLAGPNGGFSDGGMSFGCATSDYDLDGDLDIVVTNASDPFLNYLYGNLGASNHWIKIRCVGQVSNRSAIGTKVWVKAMISGSPVWQKREISGQTGYSGQNSLTAHFGLGTAAQVDSVRVEWPSGIKLLLGAQEVDRLFVLEEDAMVLPPRELAALEGYGNAIPLAWKPPQGSAGEAVRSYRLRRYDQSGALNRTVDNITGSSFRDEPVNPNETFSYEVRAQYDAAESGTSNIVQAQAPTSGYAITSFATGAVPRLDGVITPGEWGGGTDITAPGDSGKVTLYALNTADMLFFAVDDKRDVMLDSNDAFGIFFDSNKDRAWPNSSPSSEGLIQMFQSGTLGVAANAFYNVQGVWPGSLNVDPRQSTPGVYQMISASVGHTQYEGALHLAEGPLRTSPDATVGILIYVWNGNGEGFTGVWPQETIRKLPAFSAGNAWAYGPFSYGDVKLTSTSTMAEEVTFRVAVPANTPATDTIYLAGDFNFWDPGSGGTAPDGYHHDLRMTSTGPGEWSLTIPFLRGETVQYKFTRGSWAKVEKGSQGEEVPNRMLVVPDTSSIVMDVVARWADVVGSVSSEQIPDEYALAQNYPNPFNPSTTIRYGLPNRSQVTLNVYDALGRQVAMLVSGEVDAGYHEIEFDARNLASGVYFYRLQAGSFVGVKKLVLTR